MPFPLPFCSHPLGAIRPLFPPKKHCMFGENISMKSYSVFDAEQGFVLILAAPACFRKRKLNL